MDVIPAKQADVGQTHWSRYTLLPSQNCSLLVPIPDSPPMRIFGLVGISTGQRVSQFIRETILS